MFSPQSRQLTQPALQLTAASLQQLPQATVVALDFVPFLLVTTGPTLQPLTLLLRAQVELLICRRKTQEKLNMREEEEEEVTSRIMNRPRCSSSPITQGDKKCIINYLLINYLFSTNVEHTPASLMHQTHRQTHRQKDRQTVRQTDRKKDRQTVRQTHRQSDTQTQTERQTERKTDSQTERRTDRQTIRQTDRRRHFSV